MSGLHKTALRMWREQRQTLRVLMAAKCCESYQAVLRLHRRRDAFSLVAKPPPNSPELEAWLRERNIIEDSIDELDFNSDYVFENIDKIEELGGKNAIDQYGFDVVQPDVAGVYEWCLDTGSPKASLRFLCNGEGCVAAEFVIEQASVQHKLHLHASDLDLAKRLFNLMFADQAA